MPRPEKEERFEQWLRPYREEYARVVAGVDEVGFVLRGSIGFRRIPCGQPTCSCRDSGVGHGPYYQVTWKEGGKTVSRFLPVSVVPLYRAWIANAHALDRVVERMHEVSRQAAEAVRVQEAQRGKAGKSSRNRQGPR